MATAEELDGWHQEALRLEAARELTADLDGAEPSDCGCYSGYLPKRRRGVKGMSLSSTSASPGSASGCLPQGSITALVKAAKKAAIDDAKQARGLGASLCQPPDRKTPGTPAARTKPTKSLRHSI